MTQDQLIAKADAKQAEQRRIYAQLQGRDKTQADAKKLARHARLLQSQIEALSCQIAHCQS